MFLYLIFAIIGFCVSIYSFSEVGVWCGLYFDRDYFCIEKYRKQQKICDAISVFHNLVVSYSGILVFFMSVAMLFSITNVNFRGFKCVAYILFIIDDIIMYYVSTRTSIPEIKNNIKKQWGTQKKVSPENDHEVNMYRGAVRVCHTYVKHNLFYIVMLFSCALTYNLTQ